MKTFNINDHIEVKLTERGKLIFYHILKREYPKPNIEGLYRFQMWDFMNTFGEHFYNGAENVIVDNTILIDEEDLKNSKRNVLTEGGYELQYEADEHYATITQQFTRYDGKRSYYDCLSGSGQFTVRLKFKSVINRSKAEAKKLVYEILKQHVWDLDSFEVIDNNYGWTYERYVKVNEEDISKYEITNKGEHTDHEVLDVYVFYIYEDVGAYIKLL